MSTNAKEAKDKKRLKVFKDLQSSEDAKIKEVKLKYEQNSFKRPSRNNHMTEQLFRDKRDKFKTEYILKTNYIIADRNCSSISDTNKLKKITLKEMFVNHIHSNQYLECKTAAVPYYLSGLNLLIQDSNGDMETVILYNFDYNESPSELFPFGTKLVIKDPHFQLIGLDENDFAIRVDSPTDLIITYSNDATSTKKVDELIEIGNKHFTNNQFHVSIRLYTQAIEKSLKTSVRAYLNRSQAYIKLEKYYAANQDAQQAVKLDELNEKAHFRSGKSAYLMRNFKKALESFQTCLKINPKNKEVQIEIEKTNQRIKESTTGEYDFKNIYELFFKGENLYMDIADYWSDKIEVADIKNKSKGVKANALIKKGTLICCNKAASAVFYNKEDYRTKSYTKVDFYENKFSTRNETENISNLIYKMNDNPELAAKIYSLYGGDKFSRDSTPFIDVKRIEAIHEFNSFQIQNSFEALKIIEITNEIAPGYNNDDFKEIDFGSIKFESDLFKKLTELQIKIQNIDKQCGLWYMSAFFNHACISNAIMDFIGDVMTIYAIRDIQKDEEILIR
jgi:tetratricopeptide (TPR) repeat protein